MTPLRSIRRARFFRWLPASAARACHSGMTPILTVETPLPLFAVGTIAAEHANHFLVEVEAETEKVLGSFGLREYDAPGW
jgi:hypothetical protein